jgi:hypothetical protein
VSYTKELAAIVQPESYALFEGHAEFDEVFRLWTRGDPFRGLDKVRLWSLILNIKHVLAKHPGALAELGVYQGQCSAVLSYYAEIFGRTMYLVDAFDVCTEYDTHAEVGKQAEFRRAREVIGDYEGNRWIDGIFPDSITDDMRNDRYSFVSIDCDVYQGTIAGLTFFWPRMVKGGMIFVHDYSSGYRPGAKGAVDDFCRQSGTAGILLPDFSGTFALTR